MNLSLTKQNNGKSMYQSIALRQLGKLNKGYVRLVLPNDVHELGDKNAQLSVEVVVHDTEFFKSTVLGGSVGAAESYIKGQWQCSDLTTLVRILVLNIELVDGMEGGAAVVLGWVMKFMHLFNKNTLNGSKKNISAHYDLGNDLFELFLDKDWMMYSSGLYNTPQDTLEQAQANKLNRLCQQLKLNEKDHLLEIGTGWGGCAVFAAQNYGCKVTTTTISQEQFDYAQARVKEAGLEDKITVLLKDYRLLAGQFDKLISIEMVEAVGHNFLDEYFQRCHDLLTPSGVAIIQAITIQDHRYKQALNSVDFIKRYIFPGSFIPCVSVLTHSAAKAKLRLVDLKDIGTSYAKTLKDWRVRFFEDIEQVKSLGYSDEFIRMWEFYLCYCEGGFEERSISDVHLLFAKEDARH